jgi:hypothetical protein
MFSLAALEVSTSPSAADYIDWREVGIIDGMIACLSNVEMSVFALLADGLSVVG